MGKIDLKKKKSPLFSIILFVLVLFISIWIYAYNIFLEKNIEEVNIKIQRIEDGIKEEKKDKALQIYILLKENKNILSKMDKNNQITKYMKHLNDISRENSIDFKGFTLSNSKIATKVESANKTDKILAYMNVKNFIKNYRKSKKALFSLDFINLFNGTDLIKFNANFIIK